MLCKKTLQSFLLGIFTLAFSGISFAKPLVVKRTAKGIPFVAQEFLVKLKAGMSQKDIGRFNAKHGTAILSTVRQTGVFKLKTPQGKSAEKMVEIFNNLPGVEYAELNSVCKAFWKPNDRYYDYQWHLKKINMESAWDLEKGDPAIVVAVLDTGVAYNAPDLAETNFVQGKDFVNGDDDPSDDNGHGTHVIGTIAQSTDNDISPSENDIGKGVAGVAFNCSIMPIKMLDKKGEGTLEDLINAISWATDNGAKVINMSLGWPVGYNPGQMLATAISDAYNSGVVLVAASGNGADDLFYAGGVSYPAADDNVITVGATHYGDKITRYSQYGQAMELTAPGGDTNDRDYNGYIDGVLQQTFDATDHASYGYSFYFGTSMATSHVSALAALLMSRHLTENVVPDLTENSFTTLQPDEVRQILCDTSADLGDPGWDIMYGCGRIDAYAALSYYPPVSVALKADAGQDQKVPDKDRDGFETVTLDGSGSEGDSLSYNWSWNDGGSASGISPTVSFPVGTYTITLTVSDGSLSDIDEVVVTVKARKGKRKRKGKGGSNKGLPPPFFSY